MKIAVVNQFSNAGGGARFVRALVSALARVSPDVEITLLADASAVERDAIGALFEGLPNVTVRTMRNEFAVRPKRDSQLARRLRKLAKGVRPLRRYYQRWRARRDAHAPVWFEYTMDEATIAELGTFDVVHLAWPYFIEPAVISAPVVVTMHDFNFKYPFGVFSDRMLELLESQTQRWIELASTVVVSAEFMSAELAKFYPTNRTPVRIVRLTHFSITKPAEDDLLAVREKFGLSGPYMVCASNMSRHKNIEALIRAIALLKSRGVHVPLLLAGAGTERVGEFVGSDFPDDHPLAEFERLSNTLVDLDLEVGTDLLPVGYVSDVEIDSLIQGAMLVVAPSLYEAGSGPALDAWQLETPVAFSDIPPFREHLEFLGTEALLFDPTDVADIADVLQVAIENPERMRDMAVRSKNAIDNYSWENVAEGYHRVFAEAIARKDSDE